MLYCAAWPCSGTCKGDCAYPRPTCGCHCAAACGAAPPMQPCCLSNAAAPPPSVCVNTWFACVCVFPALLVPASLMLACCIEVPPRDCLNTTTSILSMCACSYRRCGCHRASCFLVCQSNAGVGAALHRQPAYGMRLNLQHVFGGGAEQHPGRLGCHPNGCRRCIEQRPP